jgi:multidrug efflux pump subunit AcrB
MVRAKLSEGLEMDSFPSASHSFVTASANFPQDKTERLLGLSSSRTLAVRGNSRDEVKARTALTREKLASTAVSVRESPSGTRPELRLFPNREASAHIGISAAGLARSLYTATEGVIPIDLEITGRPLPVRVLASLPKFETKAMLEGLPVAQTESGALFLGSVSAIEKRETEARLARLDRADVIYLEISENDANSRDLPKIIENLTKSTAGVSRSDESAFSQYRTSLIVTVVLVAILLYMTMASQFESFFLPVILMLSIPFSIAGVGPALFLSSSGLDSGSVLGLVVLFGLVVNNGIILYEISVEKIDRGLPLVQAVFTGAIERLRPILITTLTTIFSLLPLAISPFGSSQKSMAAAMLGGIIASTLLSLFALPPVFVKVIGKK